VANTSSAYDLWKQAGGGTEDYDRAEYRRLALAAGLLVETTEPAPKCTDPTHGTCGYFCETCNRGKVLDADEY
jgi:hypothetical protein